MRRDKESARRNIMHISVMRTSLAHFLLITSFFTHPFATNAQLRDVNANSNPNNIATKSKDDESTRVLSKDEACDQMEAAYAPVCCPLVDPAYETFCASFFQRPHHSSTGMIEMHAPWIGEYPVGENIVQPADGSIPAPTSTPTANPTNTPTGLFDFTMTPTSASSNEIDNTLTPTSASSYQIDDTMTPTSASSNEIDNTMTPTSASSTQVDNTTMASTEDLANEVRDCDKMEAAFAPVCCPLEDPTYEEFCKSLFGRPHQTSTGMIEMHAPWIGEYPVAKNHNHN